MRVQSSPPRFSCWEQRSKTLDRLIDGVPLLIVANGKPLKDRMQKARIDEEDVLAAARELRGLDRLDQVKFAILERNGGITIIPQRGDLLKKRKRKLGALDSFPFERISLGCRCDASKIDRETVHEN